LKINVSQKRPVVKSTDFKTNKSLPEMTIVTTAVSESPPASEAMADMAKIVPVFIGATACVRVIWPLASIAKYGDVRDVWRRQQRSYDIIIIYLTLLKDKLKDKGKSVFHERVSYVFCLVC